MSALWALTSICFGESYCWSSAWPCSCWAGGVLCRKQWMKPRIYLLGLLRNRTRYITDPMSTYSLDQRTAHWTGLKLQFNSIFEAAPTLYRAPGRVNLIGEHTDYNDGFVMPAAIDFYVWIAIAPRNDRKLLLHSTNFSQTVEIDLQNGVAPRNHWSDYVSGVAVMLERAG